MTTKHGKMVTYFEELAPINLHDPYSQVRSRDKLNKLYVHLQKIRGHQTK